MVAPNEKLAASLAQLRKLQTRGRRVFRSGELTRVHRERLVRNGFLARGDEGLADLQQLRVPIRVTRRLGLLPSGSSARPTARPGSARNWHLSPEQSLLLHAENTVIPRQVIVHTPGGANNTVELLFGTSLFDLKTRGTCRLTPI